jgi:hypothetical protein
MCSGSRERAGERKAVRRKVGRILHASRVQRFLKG